MAIDYLVLKTEIETDPTGIGYAPQVALGSDTGVADLINQIRDTIELFRDGIGAAEVFEAVNAVDFGTLTALQTAKLSLILSQPALSLRGANIRTMLGDIFLVGSQTRINLIALAKRKASRAEQLFGYNISIAHVDVAKALRG